MPQSPLSTVCKNSHDRTNLESSKPSPLLPLPGTKLGRTTAEAASASRSKGAGTRRTREKAYRGREKVEMRDRQVVEGHTHGRGGWVHGGRHGVKGVGGGQRKCQIFRPCQAGQVVGEDVHVIMMKY